MGSTGRRRRGRPGGAGHRGRQIFVDASGRRRKAVRYGMAAAGLVFAGYVVVLIAGLFGTGPADDQLPWVRGKPEPSATSERPQSPEPSRATRPPAESDTARTPTPSATASESSSASPEASRSSSKPPADDTASATPGNPGAGASRGSGNGNGGNGTEPPGHGR